MKAKDNVKEIRRSFAFSITAIFSKHVKLYRKLLSISG